MMLLQVQEDSPDLRQILD